MKFSNIILLIAGASAISLHEEAQETSADTTQALKQKEDLAEVEGKADYSTDSDEELAEGEADHSTDSDEELAEYSTDSDEELAEGEISESDEEEDTTGLAQLKGESLAEFNRRDLRNAMSVAAGFVEGVLHDAGGKAIVQCLKSPGGITRDARHIMYYLKRKDVARSMRPLGRLVKTISRAAKYCRRAPRQIRKMRRKLRKLIGVFKKGPRFTALMVSKNVLTRPHEIFREASGAVRAAQRNQWNSFGINLGKLTETILLGNDKAMIRDMMKAGRWTAKNAKKLGKIFSKIRIQAPRIRVPHIRVPRIRVPRVHIRVPRVRIRVPRIRVPRIRIRAPRIRIKKFWLGQEDQEQKNQETENEASSPETDSTDDTESEAEE